MEAGVEGGRQRDQDPSAQAGRIGSQWVSISISSRPALNQP
jgi:hypothetical protein